MKKPTMHLHPARVAALSLLLALAGCGGGSDSPASAPAPAPAPSPTPAPAPGAPDRIEPFDPAAVSKAAPAPRLAVPLAAPTPGATITLPALATAKAAAALPGTPLQIGQGRTIEATATAARTAALLTWQTNAAGEQAAALRFVAEGALGLRLGIQFDALPEGARLSTHGSSGQPHTMDANGLRALMERNRKAGTPEPSARTWWSPEVAGEQVTLVITLPADADPRELGLAVPRLSQRTLGDQEEQQLAKAKAGAGSCEVDVACRPDYIEQGRSVARLRYVATDGKAYQCTGTLMNDMAFSATPYLLTAHHCITDQAVASTLITDWLLRAAACNGSTTAAGQTQLVGGATLLYTNADADTTLVRLHDAAPAGVVFAGSYFGADALPGTAISVVHQPDGDLQKISLGQIGGFSMCDPGSDVCVPSSSSRGSYFSVQWQQGVVEPGSSGSGAFMAIGQRRYLIGQLYGGSSSCTNPNGLDYFARFDLNYTNALHQWLNP